MTTVDTRTAATPATIEGRFVETAPPVPAPPMPKPKVTGQPIAAGQPVYVHNPHLIPLVGSAVATLLAGAGTAWSLYHGDARSDVAFGLLLGLFFVLAVSWRRFWAWDEA